MPLAVLDKARKVLSEREVPVEELIGELNERRAWLDKEENEIRALRRTLAEERKKYQDSSRDIESRKDRILAEAERKAESILERAEESSKELLRNVHDAAKSAVHRKISETSERVRNERKTLEQRQERRALIGAAMQEGFAPVVGAVAQIAGTDYVGVIEKLQGEKAILRIGAIKMDVNAKKLVKTEKKPKGASLPRDTSMEETPAAVPSSIMVRGMNVQDALPMVERYLDQALRRGHTSVTVIHGRGEGILRREIHALCASLKYVESYRLGDAGEGGYGVTIVTFRR